MVATMSVEDSNDETSLSHLAQDSAPEDYVSFPTLPDPEVVSNHHFSTILSKTLRKVTNNASNLVHGIAPSAVTAERSSDVIETVSHISPNASVSDGPSARALTVTDTLAANSNNKDSNTAAFASAEASPLPGLTLTLPTKAITDILDRPSSSNQAPSLTEDLPRVTSDHLSLRISTMVNKHALSLIDSIGVTVVREAPSITDGNTALPHAPETLVISDVKPSPTVLLTSAKIPDSVKKSLQNRISSIFNNLPNDIELSDDLASDLDTIDNDTIDMLFRSISKKHSEAAQVANLPKQAHKSPLPSKTKPASRKSSSHFPGSIILDSAKSIISNKLGGVTSASLIIESLPRKKKRMKPATSSNNPLKNGGIPKRYWMNDLFVSECLSCFKPFTAFKRKHHCRFCGQIFCSDCTMFISYRQYKDQRQQNTLATDLQAYQDKLRVCKPCYSDVIVYLSDDSLSSSESEEDLDTAPARSISEDAVSFLMDDDGAQSVIEHPLSKLRSRSINSRRNSVNPDLAIAISNRTFMKDSDSLSAVEGTQRSPEGLARRFPPQMAIPTTRTGEAVEIPASKKSIGYFAPIQANGAAAVSENDFSESKLWFSTKHGPLAQEIMHSRSLENLGNFYKAVVNNRYVRLPSGQDLKFASPKFEEKEDLIDDEIESENEDEQAMSLYTSLNPLNPLDQLNSLNQINSLSQLNSLNPSLVRVPTLREFPMFMDDKYIPVNFGQTDTMKRFEFKPIDSFHSASINESKHRSDLRSNERAKASLRRIKDRRTHKSGRKSHGSTLKLPPIDTGHLFTGSAVNIGSNTLTPVLPTPRSLVLVLPTGSVSDSGPGSFGPATNEESGQPNANSTDTATNYGDIKKRLQKHFRDMMMQCLEDCDMKDAGQQRGCCNALLRTFSQIDALKIGDTLDVKQYIKIKKILGGSIGDTRVLNGMFITKDVDSKRMQLCIDSPRIALLVFPLEYLKQKEQFISLRIVHSQQSVYISNLVSRLVSLGPDIVIVGDTVCGLALKLLEDARVTVLSNVKPQVIERISRYTKSGIFQSVNELFFKKGILGTCRRFEIKKYIYKDLIKTYAFFTGILKEAGFTLCLRGGDEEFLSSFKYAAESLVPAAFNSSFEHGFFQDFSLHVLSAPVNPGIAALATLNECLAVAQANSADNKLMCLKVLERCGVLNYVQLFSTRVLSILPTVQFALPVPLANLITSLKHAMDFYEFNSTIQKATDADQIERLWLERLQFNFSLERFSSNQELVRMVKFVSDERLRALLHNFSLRGRLWSNCMKYTTYQLYPIFHKSIRFLHSCVSIKNATPCYGPVVVVVDYYSDNDKSLGLFLDQLMQESSKPCGECGELLLHHYKSYAHANAKIDMMVEKINDLPHEYFKGKDERIMWSYCPECNLSTPIRVINDETYYLSLGKFFELNFWSTSTYFQDCPHDFFRTHVKYFGFNDYVIRMEYSPIDTYEVVVPRKKLEFIAEIDIGLKLDVLSKIQLCAIRFFPSISKRLNRVKVDTSEHAEAGSKKVVELKERLKLQQQFIAKKLQNIYEATAPTNYLSLNVVQRDLQELGVAWDKEFNDFERQFLPTENEITKITQFHLQNFLMDRFEFATEEQREKLSTERKTIESEKKDVLDALNVCEGEPEFQEQSKEEVIRGKTTDNSLKKDLEQNGPKPVEGPENENRRSPNNTCQNFDRDWSEIGARMRIPLSSIGDKILQFKQSLENDQSHERRDSIIDLSVDSPQAPSKVQDLTNYFNQMTLEFQKQREKVLETKSAKFKEIPIVKSQSIVDIYDSIEDVVDLESDRHSVKQKSPTSPLDSLDVKLQQISKLDAETLTRSRVEIPQPEKNSLLKSLSNFWADRSATLWDPLEYPLDSTEHTFADSDVIVREDEPSSLVAFCLSSNDYKQKILDMATNQGVGDEAADPLEHGEQFQKKLNSFMKIEKKFKKKIDALTENTPLESIMTKTKSNHLRYSFLDGNSDLACKIFYSEQFEAFRVACGVNDSFIQSLSRCIKWHSKGGKSGSSFLKTLDDRYIVKELSKLELESFVSIAPFYFKYIAQSTFNTLTTALAKIFGFYQVEVRNSLNGKIFKMDFLIMENLFYNRKTTRIFDLKGSMRNRHVEQTGHENEVLLDENMIEYIFESPVFVKEQLKKLLKGSLFNDTAFLSGMDVMDYSLVVGLDDTSGKLYVGIIDWLRTFTWDKKVENWVKGKSLVGKKGKDPTIVTPKQYRIRFREAMDRYILEVPDIWYEGKN